MNYDDPYQQFLDRVILEYGLDINKLSINTLRVIRMLEHEEDTTKLQKYLATYFPDRDNVQSDALPSTEPEEP